MSRSVAIAVAYVMSVTSLEWKEALNAVRGARAVANPNSGFQRQLQDFSGDRVAEVSNRGEDVTASSLTVDGNGTPAKKFQFNTDDKATPG
ncbi:hypothetical protein QYM36_013970 [Artemia franciscana]|uniref:Dual specificity phosphatase catalytic domain-containing protein n=1 Tax=Artemia franciscana TaxID=6661 RepID=A0AA88HB54_ARTSF|nr:hypothetical protein QYM36_013970 [Artemia franciscana]